MANGWTYNISIWSSIVRQIEATSHMLLQGGMTLKITENISPQFHTKKGARKEKDKNMHFWIAKGKNINIWND